MQQKLRFSSKKIDGYIHSSLIQACATILALH
jgi:hypothetical protein